MFSYATETRHPSAAHDKQKEWVTTAAAHRINFCHIPGNGSFHRKGIILQCALMSIQCRQEPLFKIVIEFEVLSPRANWNQLTRFPASSAVSAGSWFVPHRVTQMMLLSHFPTVPASKARLPLHCHGWVRQSLWIVKDLNFLFSWEMGGSLLIVLFPAGGTELGRKTKL